MLPKLLVPSFAPVAWFIMGSIILHIAPKMQVKLV